MAFTRRFREAFGLLLASAAVCSVSGIGCSDDPTASTTGASGSAGTSTSGSSSGGTNPSGALGGSSQGGTAQAGAPQGGTTQAGTTQVGAGAAGASSTAGGGAGGAASGGGGQAGSAGSAATDTWETYAKGFMETYCVSCHNDDNAGSATRDYHLLEVVKGESEDIACGVAKSQEVWSARDCGGGPAARQFPPGNGAKPDDASRDRILAWIDAGMP
jgi:hypothetical protein